MRIYKIDQLFKSTALVKKANGALKDMKANVTVGGGEYTDDIIALRKMRRDADTDAKVKKADELIKAFCETHIIDDFVVDGQRLLYVDEAETV